MILEAKYVHTNLIAHDWLKLAAFYEQVFGCIPLAPERNLYGEAFDRLTHLKDARLHGVHLRLPGYGEDGPTLEIFEYGEMLSRMEPALNRPGFAHIAFLVPDVQVAYNAVLDAGGEAVGEIVTMPIGGRTFTGVYMTDPEGNILELQCWS
jgi:predicted enzyme related to lactoylglutathione lyase